MTREIKFRAWDKMTNCFMESGTNSLDILLMSQTGKTDADRWEFQQYTGLKDKNGKEIYESDLVVWGGQKNPVEIIWEEQRWYPHINITTEIIGNIYESPELLEDYEEKL